MSDNDERMKPKRDWLPLLVTLAANLLFMGAMYGKIDQRVTTLELQRVEARADFSYQLGRVERAVDQVQLDVKRLLERPR
jgi:hypothetical protein